MPDIEDVIILDGQHFPITGLVKANAVSEFESGIKVGNADYDNREHAFYVVMDDFSAGMGYRRTDIRGSLGTFWTPTGSAAPDTRRPGHVTLSGAQFSATLTSLTNFDAGKRTPSVPFCKVANARWAFGFGNQLYYSTGDHTTWAVGYTGPTGTTGIGQCEAIIETTRPDGSPCYYAAFSNFDNPPNVSGGARYVRSTDALSWSNGDADKVLDDMIWWDNKIIASWYHQIIFGVVTNTGEAWNIDDANDGLPVATITSGPIHFIGVADAAWGQPSVYFTDERDLYVLDFYNRTTYKIDLGMGTSANDGCIWQGQPTVTDGWNVVQYNVQGTSRNIGLPQQDGKPPLLRPDFRITKLIPAGAYLFALASGYSTPGVTGGTWTTVLLCYNGTGWSQVGESISDYSNVGFLLAAPPNEVSGFSYPTTHLRYIGVPHINVAGDVNNTATTTTLERFYLPPTGMTPAYGVDNFSGKNDSYGKVDGQTIQTGWMDMGFRELDGALLRMEIDGFNLSATETVTVKYRLNNDETASFVQMVNAAGTSASFDNSNTKLYFVNAVAPIHGLTFRTVQFQITLNRGTDQTKTPEVKALTLVYTKKAPVRGTYTFMIDANRMVERSHTQNDTTFFIDGQPATTARIWAKLRAIWNTQTLVPLKIPSLEDDGVAVTMTDMPMTLDDFRAAVAGKGTVAVTVLEAVATEGINGAGSDGDPLPDPDGFTVATHAAFNFPLFDPQVTLYSASGLETRLIDLPTDDPLYNLSPGYVGATWDDHFIMLVTKATDPVDQRMVVVSSAGVLGTDASLLIDASDTGAPLCIEADTDGNIYCVWKRDNTQPLQLRKYTSLGVYVDAVEFGADINTAAAGYGAWLAAGPNNAVWVLQNTSPHYTLWQFTGLTPNTSYVATWTEGPGIDIDELGQLYTARYALNSDNVITAAYVDKRSATDISIISTITMDDEAEIADIAYGDNIVFVDYRSTIAQYAAGN